MLRLYAVALLVCLFAACGGDGQTPSQTYLDYHRQSAEGMAFEEEKGWYSQRKLADVEAQLPRMAAQMNRSEDELVALYMEMSQAAAGCAELTLVDESIDGDVAVLVFDAASTCDDASDAQHRVRLLREDGWKLDDVEILL